MSEKATESIGDEATRWFVLLRDPAATERQRRDCAAWLAADPRHAEAWDELERLWDGLDPLAGASTGRRSLLLRGLACMVAAGGLLAGGGALTLWTTPGADAAVRTALGERRDLTLPGGARVEMNGGSALSPAPGGAVLFRGEAFFAVPSRFVIEARDGTLCSDGGAFNVRLTEDDVIATLVEGSLAVARIGGEPLPLAPGQSGGYGPLGPVAPRPAPLAEVLAWRQGRLVFQDAPVDEVLKELQRYLPARLVLTDEAAGRLRVTAVFDLDRLDAALDTLAAILPLRVRRVGGIAVLIGPAA